MTKAPVQAEAIETIESLRDDLKRNPKEAKNYLRLGWAYYAKGKYEDAVETFKDANDRFSDDVEVLYALALALKVMGNKDKALSYFRKVTLLAEKIKDKDKAGMLRRLAIGHANVIVDGDWNLAEETWESK
jgi:tetratricopeptide (TPR) repeat protein